MHPSNAETIKEEADRMSQGNSLEMLRNIEFLRGSSQKVLERLTSMAEVVEFRANETIFRENELAKKVYMIVKGNVSLAICEPRVGHRQVMELRAGEMFGWSPLVGHQRLADSATALSPTVAVSCDAARLLELCAAEREFGFLLMTRVAHALSERLSALRLELLKKCGLQLPTARIESD